MGPGLSVSPLPPPSQTCLSMEPWCRKKSALACCKTVTLLLGQTTQHQCWAGHRLVQRYQRQHRPWLSLNVSTGLNKVTHLMSILCITPAHITSEPCTMKSPVLTTQAGLCTAADRRQHYGTNLTRKLHPYSLVLRNAQA